MKKLALLTVALLPLVACSSEEPKTDFAVVDAVVKTATPEMFVTADVIKTPATEELTKIYAQEKNAMFNTVDGIVLEEGNCYVNVFAENEYRLFCGAEFPAEGFYAVAVVAPVEEPAEAPAEEQPAEVPAEQPAEAPAEQPAEAPAEAK